MSDYIIAALLITGMAVVVATISVLLKLSRLTNPAPGGWLSQFVFALFGCIIGELIGLCFFADTQDYGVYWFPITIFALLTVIFGTPSSLHPPRRQLNPEQQKQQIEALRAQQQAATPPTDTPPAPSPPADTEPKP